MQDSKPIYLSKTVWGTVLTPIVSWTGARYGLDVTPEVETSIVTLSMVVVALVLRIVTDRPVRILKKKEGKKKDTRDAQNTN